MDISSIITAVQEDLMDFTFIDNPFGTSFKHNICTRGAHLTLDLNLQINKDTKQLLFKPFTAATPSVQLPIWRLELKDAILIILSGEPVTTIVDVEITHRVHLKILYT